MTPADLEIQRRAVQEEVELFRGLLNDPRFVRWAEKERALAVKYLTNANEQVAILRAQGRVQLLDQMLKAV